MGFIILLTIFVVGAIICTRRSHERGQPQPGCDSSKPKTYQPVNNGNPYWYKFESFYAECRRRNPRRVPQCAGNVICMICGEDLGRYDDFFGGISPNFCPACAARMYTACQDANIESSVALIEYAEDAYKKIFLRHMIAMDVYQGVISEQQGKEDYRRVDECFMRMAAEKERLEEQKRLAEEERQRNIASTQNAIDGIMNRLQ